MEQFCQSNKRVPDLNTFIDLSDSDEDKSCPYSGNFGKPMKKKQIVMAEP
jgi:hypothetical protein